MQHRPAEIDGTDPQRRDDLEERCEEPPSGTGRLDSGRMAAGRTLAWRAKPSSASASSASAFTRAHIIRDLRFVPAPER